MFYLRLKIRYLFAFTNRYLIYHNTFQRAKKCIECVLCFQLYHYQRVRSKTKDLQKTCHNRSFCFEQSLLPALYYTHYMNDINLISRPESFSPILMFDKLVLTINDCLKRKNLSWLVLFLFGFFEH